jgi:flavin-binding protein dodecin
MDEEDDAYEDYFETQMLRDMQGIEEYEQQVDYFEALKRVEDKVASLGASERESGVEQAIDDALEAEYLMENIAADEVAEEQAGYVAEYQQVISQMSRLCAVIASNNKTDAKDKKVRVEEAELLDLCPRIWALVTEYDKQTQKNKAQCHLETLLKGTFSLLSVKYPRSVLRISSCNVHLYLKIFEKYIFSTTAHALDQAADFKKIFTYLFETMRGIFIYAKEGSYDSLFKEEGLIPSLSKVLQTCFLDHSQVIVRLTAQTVNKKEI